jgi:hypothetical protein
MISDDGWVPSLFQIRSPIGFRKIINQEVQVVPDERRYSRTRPMAASLRLKGCKEVAMRQMVLGLSLIALTSTAVGAQESSPLDAPTTLRLPNALPSCGITTALARIARTSHVAIGFEETFECSAKWPRLHFTYDDSGRTTMTVRQVLDQVVTLDPTYRWADVNGVAVVRPVVSWTDPSDALNLRVDPFRTDRMTVGQVLAILVRRPDPNCGFCGFDNRVNNRALSIDFKGGTMVDALNALVQARPGIGWHAMVQHHSTAIEDNPALWLSIRTFNMGSRDEGEGALSTGISLPVLANR